MASDDPAAGFLASLPTGGASVDDTIALLAAAPEPTVEVQLRHVRVLVDAPSAPTRPTTVLDEIADADPWEWRVAWYRGLLRLQRDEPARAVGEFDIVYRTVAGELTPKLAMAFALEQAGELDRAGAWYDTVSRTDPSYASAAFGLARCCSRSATSPARSRPYDRVPETSNAYPRAQLAKADAMLGDDAPRTPAHVAAAADVVERAGPRRRARARLEAALFELALGVVRETGDDPSAASILGHEFTDEDLRFGLEAAYRTLARFAPTASERIELVDRANGARPRTLT